jgi:hypothetical protein
MQKCQDTKFKIFNKCKKNALKVGKDPLPNGAANAAELQDVCMGTGATGIDGGSKCGADLAKKCSATNNDALFPRWSLARSVTTGIWWMGMVATPTACGRSGRKHSTSRAARSRQRLREPRA